MITGYAVPAINENNNENDISRREEAFSNKQLWAFSDSFEWEMDYGLYFYEKFHFWNELSKSVSLMEIALKSII